MEKDFQYPDDRLSELMQKIGKEIKKNLPPDIGFTLFIFDYGEGGGLFYCSSGDRKDNIEMLKEFLNKQK